MYTRLLTFTGISDVEAAVNVLQDKALSIVRSQRGYKGMTASVDQSTGTMGILSVWETAADREASESALGKTREEARMELGGGDLTIELFDQRAFEVRRPPEVGSALMVTRFRMDRARIDENLEWFHSEVAPQIMAGSGFRALRLLINPDTGEGLAGTVLDDRPALEANAEAAAARREAASGRGITFGEISFREIVFIDMP
jgi:heme-degrading monooxygenase HmoA